jgi:hypothetical protein
MLNLNIFSPKSTLSNHLYRCIVISVITVEVLGQEIVDLATRVDVVTHRLLECIRQLDGSGEWEQQGAVSCAHWLTWRIGQLSYAKVRALTRVATPQNELQLMELALGCNRGAA